MCNQSYARDNSDILEFKDKKQEECIHYMVQLTITAPETFICKKCRLLKHLTPKTD